MNPLVAAAAIQTGGSFLSGLFGGKSKEEKAAELARQRLDEADSARQNLATNQKVGSLAAMTPYRGTMMNAMFNKLGVAAPQGGPNLTQYRRPVTFDPRDEEIRKGIVGATQGAPYQGAYQQEALRRYDEARRNGMTADQYDSKQMFDSMNRQNFGGVQQKQVDDLPDFFKKKLNVSPQRTQAMQPMLNKFGGR